MKDFFKLDCGRPVKVDAFYCEHTYLGLLEGRPSEGINVRILDSALNKARTMWGERKVHVVPPRIDYSMRSHPTLPPMYCVAWLWSYQPIVEPNDASTLVVLWFRDDCSEMPLAQVVYDGIRALPWDDLAEDFCW